MVSIEKEKRRRKRSERRKRWRRWKRSGEWRQVEFHSSFSQVSVKSRIFLTIVPSVVETR